MSVLGPCVYMLVLCRVSERPTEHRRDACSGRLAGAPGSTRLAAACPRLRARAGHRGRRCRHLGRRRAIRQRREHGGQVKADPHAGTARPASTPNRESLGSGARCSRCAPESLLTLLQGRSRACSQLHPNAAH